MTPELELALKEAIAELEGKWPVPYARRKPKPEQHMVGYSRARGRRPILEDEQDAPVA